METLANPVILKFAIKYYNLKWILEIVKYLKINLVFLAGHHILFLSVLGALFPLPLQISPTYLIRKLATQRLLTFY